MCVYCVYNKELQSFDAYCGMCNSSPSKAIECQFYINGMCVEEEVKQFEFNY